MSGPRHFLDIDALDGASLRDMLDRAADAKARLGAGECLAKIRIPIHQSTHTADFPAAGRQSWAWYKFILDRLFQPDIDVEQTAAATRRCITALQS